MYFCNVKKLSLNHSGGENIYITVHEEGCSCIGLDSSHLYRRLPEQTLGKLFNFFLPQVPTS